MYIGGPVGGARKIVTPTKYRIMMRIKQPWVQHEKTKYACARITVYVQKGLITSFGARRMYVMDLSINQ